MISGDVLRCRICGCSDCILDISCVCTTCRENESISLERMIKAGGIPAPPVDIYPPTDTRAILTERGKRYGKFSTHAAISQKLLEVCQGLEPEENTSWGRMDCYQREALTLIMHKIARILNGDPNYDDTWKDICGYSQLVVDILNKDER